MGGTHTKETNLTKITKRMMQDGKNGKSFMINTIPKTPLWIIGEKNKNNKWKISICNPSGTTIRLVSKNKTEEDYAHIWKLLTTVHLPKTMKHAIYQAKKHVHNLIQNKIIKE